MSEVTVKQSFTTERTEDTEKPSSDYVFTPRAVLILCKMGFSVLFVPSVVNPLRSH